MHRLKLAKGKLAKKKKHVIIIAIALILTVQVICLCCVSVASAGEHSAAGSESAGTVPVKDEYVEVFNEKAYISSLTLAVWLKDLMDATGERLSYTGTDTIYEEAVKRGILSEDYQNSLYTPLDRDLVCMTLCRAMDYSPHSTDFIKDISADSDYMATAAYYGYFLPNDKCRISPEALITNEEYEHLRGELNRCRMFRGKSLLAFGDSIMYGTGNNGSGIARMIAEKYGMELTDYSVPGETMGVSKRRGHIPDQIRKAVKEKAQADIILINGGTNDMFLTSLGKLTRGYDMSKVSEDTFTGGFERAMWLIKQNWDATVVYVRSHNMDLGTPENEKKFGERGLDIAEKWGAATVDIYNDTDLNTEDPDQCELYTYPNPKLGYTCDSIHPSAFGYAKFYLPLVSEAMTVSYTDSIFPE